VEIGQLAQLNSEQKGSQTVDTNHHFIPF